MGFTICTVSDILCPQTLESREEQLAVLMEKKEKKLLTGKKRWKKLNEEPHRRDHSASMDQHATVEACREKNICIAKIIWYKFILLFPEVSFFFFENVNNPLRLSCDVVSIKDESINPVNPAPSCVAFCFSITV